MSFGRDGASATVGPVCWQKTHNPLMKTSKKHPNLLLEGLTPQRRTEILIPQQQNRFLMRLEDFKQLWLSPAPSKTRSNVFKMRRADRLIHATVFALRHTVKAPHTHNSDPALCFIQKIPESRLCLNVSTRGIDSLSFLCCDVFKRYVTGKR